MTVQDLIDQLAEIEDRSRKVLVAGGLEPPQLVGRYTQSGHVIIWDARALREAESKAGRRFF